MDTRTGEIHPNIDKFLEGVVVEEQPFFIPVVRDLTAREEADKQILLYSPCACGSGKKFKFCCKR